MEPEEVGAMIARLQGDGSSYMSMLQQAAQSSQQTAGQVIQFGQQIQGFQGNIQSFGGVVISTLQRIGAEGTLRQLFSLFEQHEEIHIKLKIAVQAHGGAVRETMKSYEDFAAQISATTTLGKDSVLALLKRAEAFGLTGTKATSAVQSAIALGEASDTSAEAMIRMTAQFEQGDLKRAMAFARMVPQLRGVRDQTEFVAKYQALVNVGMKQTEELAKTAGGQLKQLSNSWTGFKKELGATVAEAIKPFIIYFKTAIDLFKGMSPETKKMIVYVLGAVAAFVSLAGAASIAIAIFGPLIATVFPVIITGLGLLLSPLGLLAVALTAGAGLWVYYSGAGTTAIQWLTQQFQTFYEYVKPAIDGIKDAIKAGKIELAFQILWAEVQLVFMEGIQPLSEMWVAFKLLLIETIVDAGVGIQKAWGATTDWLQTSFLKVMEMTGQLPKGVSDVISKAINDSRKVSNTTLDASAKAAKQAIQTMAGVEMAGVKKNIDDLKKERDRLVGEAATAAAKIPPIKEIKAPDIKMPTIPPIALKAKIEKIDFSAFGSAEASAKLREQADKFSVQVTRGGEYKGKDPNTGLLHDIRDLMKQMASKEGVSVEGADLDEF